MNANPHLEKCPYCDGSGHIESSLALCIRQLREGHGETQQRFAVKVGVSRTQIANLEGGRTRGSDELLMRIADRYGVSIDWILGRQA